MHTATTPPAQQDTGTQCQQPYDNSQGVRWEQLQAVQQWLGVLGGGLLLQVRGLTTMVVWADGDAVDAWLLLQPMFEALQSRVMPPLRT